MGLCRYGRSQQCSSSGRGHREEDLPNCRPLLSGRSGWCVVHKGVPWQFGECGECSSALWVAWPAGLCSSLLAGAEADAGDAPAAGGYSRRDADALRARGPPEPRAAQQPREVRATGRRGERPAPGKQGPEKHCFLWGWQTLRMLYFLHSLVGEEGGGHFLILRVFRGPTRPPTESASGP